MSGGGAPPGGAGALVASLADLGLAPDEAAYLRLHGERYRLLLEGLRARLDGDGRGRRILDVGPGPLTALIRRAFPAARVDSLGFASPLAAPRAGERHLDLDLNRAAAGPPRSVEPYDAIVFAEVIEHLAAPPREVLGLLAGLLAPGGFIALQTPNALALHKRLRALAGRSPLGAGGGVAAPSHSQAHFREYTLAELEELGRTVGLEPEEARIANHFRHPGLAARAYDRLTAALPPGTRQGITVYLRRPRA